MTEATHRYWIRRICIENTWTQQDLAKAVGVHPSSVSRWMTSKSESHRTPSMPVQILLAILAKVDRETYVKGCPSRMS